MMAGDDGAESVDGGGGGGGLTPEQQEKLRQFKIKIRIDNEKYMRSHPEVEALIGGFLRDVLLKRPDDIREFAADHFTNPNLHELIGSKTKSDETESDPSNS